MAAVAVTEDALTVPDPVLAPVLAPVPPVVFILAAAAAAAVDTLMLLGLASLGEIPIKECGLARGW